MADGDIRCGLRIRFPHFIHLFKESELFLYLLFERYQTEGDKNTRMTFEQLELSLSEAFQLLIDDRMLSIDNEIKNRTVIDDDYFGLSNEDFTNKLRDYELENDFVLIALKPIINGFTRNNPKCIEITQNFTYELIAFKGDTTELLNRLYDQYFPDCKKDFTSVITGMIL